MSTKAPADRITGQPRLPVVLLRATFIAEENWRWPSHPGSAWRGAFGWALKRVVCAMRLRPCAGCMLSSSCLYPYAFNTEPPASATVMSRYDRVPHPFALHLGPMQSGELPAGSPLHLYLTLIGVASRQAAFFIRALQVAGETGIGTRRIRFVLSDVAELDPETGRTPRPLNWSTDEFRSPTPIVLVPPSRGGLFRLELQTPLRLKAQGTLVTPQRFAPAHLLSSAVRRVAMLMYFHTETQLTADYPALKRAAAAVRMTTADLRWHEMTRRSSRQGMTLQAGGLHGSITLDFNDAPDLWPFLRLGEVVQVGKGTSMGLGVCAMQPLS